MSLGKPLIEPLFSSDNPGRLLPLVQDFARQEEMFKPGGRVLVAVSGGPDSVALLHLLVRLRKEWDLELGVAHFDHALRGEASREEARFVAGLARSLGLPVYLGLGEVRQLARRQKISLQMAARRLRLDFLQEVRRDHAYDHLALGHTADDQVELFFLRLLRGAGAEGLKGMWPRTAEGLVRPLLIAGKDLVLAWLRQENLAYCQDQSNLSRRYLRNRVRLDLLPALLKEYNPRLKTAVWRLMALLKEDERVLARVTENTWELVGRFITPDLAVLSLPRLAELDFGLMTRLLRRTLGRYLSHQEITQSQVRALLSLGAARQSGGILDFGTCLVARAGEELHFFKPLPPPISRPFAILPGEGLVEHPSGWRLGARSLAEPPAVSGPLPLDKVWVNQREATFPLKLRAILPGDRFWPAGAPGVRKMQDFLVDAKIPRWLRPHLPIVTSRSRVVWVPGLRLAEPVRPTAPHRGVLELTLTPTKPETARVWELLVALRQRRNRAE
uniref:tRNA(Ile)-lysidine synthase n=1 Tax=Desulfobacca acetoxidans TaxID=60893 RepID=A0A7C5ELN6_9BACT